VQGHRIGASLGEVLLKLTESTLQRVGLGCERQVHRRFGEREVPLRETDEVRGLLGGRRDHQGLWIGEADILTGEDDDAARDEHRILAGVDHPHEPVEGSVGIGAAHALDERADRVVVLVASAVVQETPALKRLADLGPSDRPPTIGTGSGRV